MTDTVDSVEESTPDMRLEFHIQQTEEGSVAATAPVRWCVSRDLIEQIESRKFVRPHLLLVVRALGQDTYLDQQFENSRETSVYVVPLTRELEFVTFRRPGPNEIRAVVVDAHDKAAIKKLRNISWGLSERKEPFFDEDGGPSYARVKREFKYIELNSSLTVEVPKEMFASPPPKWLAKFVRRFFPDKDLDQCHFRRRTIFSVIGAVLLLTFGQVIKVVALVVALLFGLRDIEWGELLHPWKGEVFGVVSTCGTSIWWFDRHDNKRWSPLVSLNPAILIGVPAILWGAQQLIVHNGGDEHHHQLRYWGWWHVTWVTDGIIIAATLVVILITALAVGIIALVSSITGSETRRARKRKQRLADEEAMRSQIARSLEQMVCDGTRPSTGVSLKTLPKGKRTVHLRYSNRKTKVCRPFAR